MQELIIFLVALIIHEIAHIVFLWLFLGRIPKVKYSISNKEIVIGEPKDYRNLTKIQKFMVYMSGVLVGYLIIGIGNIYSPESIYWFFISGFYTILCMSDFNNTLKLITTRTTI